MATLLKTSRHALSRAWRYLWWSIITLSLLFALTLLALRLALPVLGDYRIQAQQMLSEHLQQPVTLQQLAIGWSGWTPEVRIDRLAIGTEQRPLVELAQSQARIDLLQSLWRGRVIVSDLRLNGGEITLYWPSQSRLLQRILDRITDVHYALIQVDQIWLQFASGERHTLGQGLSLRLHGAAQVHGAAQDPAEGRQLSGEMALNPALGSSLSLLAQLDESGRDGSGGRFYLRGQTLKISALTELIATPTRFSSGFSELELWGEWRDMQLNRLVLQSDLTALSLVDEPETQALQARLQALAQVRLNLQGQHKTSGWHWRIQAQEQAATPSLAINAEWENQADTGWHGHLRGAQLADLSGLVASFWPQSKYQIWLTRLQPAGRVPKLEFSWQGQREQLTLTATLQDLRSQPWRNIPGLLGVNGQLQLSGDAGRLELAGNQVEINGPLLRQTLSLKTLAGPLYWHKTATGWEIGARNLQLANPDFNIRLNGTVQLAENKPPEFDLRADYGQINSARIPAYLPVAIMQPKLLAWLDRALGAGRITQGQLVFRGRTGDFPFEYDEGEFEARFRVADLRLDYFPGWTAIDDLSAEVVFRNQSFEVLADNGTLGGIDLKAVKARINDLRHAELQVNAHLNGATATMLEIVADSPLREQVWSRLKHLQVSGDNELTLGLRIPLEKENNKLPSLQLDGTVTFAGGHIQLPKPTPALENLRGDLVFNKSEVSASGLQLQFLGKPAQLTIQTGPDTFNFALSGLFDTAALIKPYSVAVSRAVRGVSDWLLELELPKQQQPDDHNQLDLALHSDLKGTEIVLPEPLGKAASTTRVVKLLLAVVDNDLSMQLETETRISSALSLRKTETEWRLQRAEVRIGDGLGPAELPSRDELVLKAHLPSYRVGMEKNAAPDGMGLPGMGLPGTGLPSAGLSVFDRSEIEIERLYLSDWQMQDVQLQGQRVADGYQFKLGGPDVAGDLFLPKQIKAAEPVHLTLSKLKLKQSDIEPSEPVSEPFSKPPAIWPTTWPPLYVEINALAVDEHRLGPLTVQLTPLPDGLDISKLELSAPGQQLSASGGWRTDETGSRSHIKAKFYSRSLAETFDLLDIPLQLERAKAALGLELNWPGTLNKPDLSQLNGVLQVHIEEGLLAGIEPGLGRLVGLVNVTSLARRLTLGFSDLVEEGLAFDQIDGTINFAHGRATAEDVLLQGPAVNIAIQGWLGLHDQNLQQTIIVIPQIASSLALAGAVAGGPVMGAAVLLAGQVLKPGLEKAVSFRYAVSGTLADPVVEQVDVEVSPDKSMSTGGRK